MADHALLIGRETYVELKSVTAVLEREIECSYRVFGSVAACATMTEQKRFGRAQFTGELVKIEVANKRLVNVGTLFGAAQRLLEFLFQQITALPLRFH